MKNLMMTALKLFIIMTILTGILYPICITGIAEGCFPAKANGSLLRKDGQIVGSRLIGQSFDSDLYFWSRPSAVNYQTTPSGASNLAITNKKLRLLMAEREKDFRDGNNLDDGTRIPSEMIFASGSGLDPHISVEAAVLQVKRIAKARHLTQSQSEELLDLIGKVKESRQLGLLGEPEINVLILNLEMDNLFKTVHHE
jgi:K+-transporting ATPase, C subunit